ncbi:MAG: hypothetical protein QOH21_826, partial [Acidobacteriota bacterium]|nr:hypothetical protein [Acidobacteriota bacterium]
MSAWAASLVVVHGTPIDRALPLLAAIVTLLAMASHPAVQAAVPLLFVVEIALPDEPTRLLVLGVVLALAWSAAVLASSAADYAKRLECGAFRPLLYSHRRRPWLHATFRRVPSAAPVAVQERRE